jgi:hypothetical protein
MQLHPMNIGLLGSPESSCRCMIDSGTVQVGLRLTAVT